MRASVETTVSVPLPVACSISSSEDVHGTENRDRAAKPEHEHLLALLRLRVLGDRATGIERVVLVHLGGIEILGFALEEIHDAYLPAGTTT